MAIPPLHLAAIRNQVDALKTLLESEADSNLQNIHGNTPLHIAILNDDKESVSVLLNNTKTNVAIRNKKGETPTSLMNDKISKIIPIDVNRKILSASESKRRLDADPGNEGPPSKKPRAARLGDEVAPRQRS